MKDNSKLLERFKIRISDQDFRIEIYNHDISSERVKTYSVIVNGTPYQVEVESFGPDDDPTGVSGGPSGSGTGTLTGININTNDDKYPGPSPGITTPMSPTTELPDISSSSLSSGPGSSTSSPSIGTGDMESDAVVDVEGKTLSAPMPGKILEIKINIGDRVEAGQPLVILEAMKMENVLTAPVSGIVTAIPIKPGIDVKQGDELVVIK